MTRFLAILLAGLLLAQPVMAREPSPESQDTATRRKELSRELDAIVDQAVNAGLINRSGSTGSAQGPKVITPRAETQKLKPVAVPPGAPEALPMPSAPAEPARETIDCSKPYPLDFSEFREISQYGDIYAYREESPGPGEARREGAGHPGSRLARAYLALDLSAEAAMTLTGSGSQDAVALSKLALLLEGEEPPPVAYFTQLAGCYPEAALWQGLALVAAQDGSGGPILEDQLKAFRALPLQLRDRAAMIAVPGLDGLGQQMLAKLLIAGFTEGEINNSSQLQFSKAVLGLSVADPDAEKLIAKLLIQSRFQDAALAALIRHQRPVMGELREILFDDKIKRIEVAKADSDILKDLRFVLDEMSAKSMYGPMIRLAELPSLQVPAARLELSMQLAKSIERDLASEDSLLNLAALDVLAEDKGLLDAVPNRADLYESATILAVKLGFGGLGETLAVKAQGGLGVAEQRAALAYRQRNLGEVFALASKHPENQKIALTAALAAIESNDRVQLARIEPRLSLEPDTILALIEQDAASGHWIVSGPIFDAAGKLTDPAQKQRVDRVTDLRTPPAVQATPSRVPMSTIAAKLDRSRQSLSQLSGETP